MLWYTLPLGASFVFLLLEAPLLLQRASRFIVVRVQPSVRVPGRLSVGAEDEVQVVLVLGALGWIGP